MMKNAVMTAMMFNGIAGMLTPDKALTSSDVRFLCEYSSLI